MQDDLPDTAGDPDPSSIPPPRRSAKRLRDISHKIADYGQTPPDALPDASLPLNGAANPDGEGEVHVDGEGMDVGNEAFTEGQDVDGEGELEDDEEEEEEEEEEEGEEDDEDSELSEDFDAAPFDHDCKPEEMEAARKFSIKHLVCKQLSWSNFQ